MCPQTLVRVDDLFEGEIQQHTEYLSMLEYARSHNNRLHIVMALSDGGVHSHIRHLHALLRILPETLDIQLHVVADGRDTPTQSLPQYLAELAPYIQNGRIHLSSLSGRYFTFDRTDNWDRVEKSYRVMTQIDRSDCLSGTDIDNILESDYAA